MEIGVMYLQAKDAAVGFVKRKTDFDIDKKPETYFILILIIQEKL